MNDDAPASAPAAEPVDTLPAPAPDAVRRFRILAPFQFKDDTTAFKWAKEATVHLTASDATRFRSLGAKLQLLG